MSADTAGRTSTVIAALFDAVREVIVTHRVSYAEYDMAKRYLLDVSEAGEWPLFADVFFEAAVELIAGEGATSSDTTIEGPYFLPGAAELEAPYVMPMRDGEPGDRLVFAGTVTDDGGNPLGGAEIDMWQCDAEGTYADIPYPDGRVLPPPGNLRGRFRTDADGRFEVRTIRPVPYEIPKAGPTGALLRAAGWHAYRPAHLHCIVSAPGSASITTQLYLDGDPYLGSDVAGAVKPGLVLPLDKPTDAQPAWTTVYDFRLAPAHA